MAICFGVGVLPAWRSLGLRRSGNTLEGLGERVPEHASPEAVASASTPSLGGGCLCFGVLPACRSFGSRRSGNTWGGWEGVFSSVRHPKLSQAPALQTWVAGAFVLECFRLAGALDRVGAGTRSSGWGSVFSSTRHPKLSRAPALQTWVAGPAMFWSASGLPELWIASEWEHVGGAGGACSRARVIQSCRKRQHSELGWLVGYGSECFRGQTFWCPPAIEYVFH